MQARGEVGRPSSQVRGPDLRTAGSPCGPYTWVDGASVVPWLQGMVAGLNPDRRAGVTA